MNKVLSSINISLLLSLTKDSNSENIWTLDIKNINKDTYDLSVVNPHIEDEVLLEPSEILKEIQKLEKESTSLLSNLEQIINEN